MVPFDRRSTNEPPAPPDSGASATFARQGTLPPPAWAAAEVSAIGTASAPSLVRLARRSGRADEAWMRARVDEARIDGDSTALHESSKELARWLGSRDRDLDEAVELAAIALSTREDIELRREMAAWLESLGASSRAAAALKPLASMDDIESQEASYVLVRAGILKARAGEGAGAAAAFDAAVSIDAAAARPAELLGALSTWPDPPVSAVAAADAYVEAARRRAAAAQDDAQIEDLWRAFALDPASDVVADGLAQALEARRLSAAADEARRAHAKAACALDSDRADAVRAAWRAAAQSLSRSGRSPADLLGEGLDLGVDRSVRGLDSDVFEALLSDLGMPDAVAARLDARSSSAARPTASLAGEHERGSRDGDALDTKEHGAAGLSTRRHGRGPDVDSRRALIRAWVAASLEGNAEAQAAGLERLADASSPKLGAVFFSVAADRRIASDDMAGGRRAAERANHADPSSLRAIAALADAVVEDADPGAASALERAISIVGPRVPWCVALVNARAALGEPGLALEASQRCVVLRPGDRKAASDLLDRLVAARDPSRLADGLAWLLSQPQPLSWMAAPFAHALRELAILDSDQAAVVARRSLDVIGARSTVLRDAMFDVAERRSDDGFSAAILERWRSSGAVAADRPRLYAKLADAMQRLGDDDSAIRVVARAVRDGAAWPEIGAHVDRLSDRAASSDAELWLLEGKVGLLSPDRAETASVLCDLGGAYWDLADDRARAIHAWRRAARADGTLNGYTALVMHLVAFSGAPAAFDAVKRILDDEGDDAIAGALGTGAASVALSLGQLPASFEFASLAIERSPSRADALEIAEWAGTQPSDQGALSALYEKVASSALGRFGRRAAHYRAARHFERRGEHHLALKHAAQAFCAVPSEGSSFQLLARAAERAGDREQAVQAIEQVAEDSAPAETQTAWLLRAASIAGDGEEGARRRLDVLLRAAVLTPSVAVIGLIRDAGKELVRHCAEESAVLEMRVGRALSAMAGRLQSANGARIALAIASVSLDLFADADGAMAALERAFACDGDVDEFDGLVASAAALATAPRARERAAKLLESADGDHTNVGIAALRVVGAIGAALDDAEIQARIAVAVALRDPDDDANVIRADAVAKTWPELRLRLEKNVSRARRSGAAAATARKRFAQGGAAEAAALFERAVELADESSRAGLERELRAAWDAAGRSAEIEARVQLEAASEAAPPAARADHWTEIAMRRESRGEKAAAVRALMEACKLDPESLERWSALERVAESAGDDSARVTALEAIAMRVGSRGRVAVFKRLARVHERRSDLESAERTWHRVLALDPEDEEADHSVEATIAEAGRYEELADHLGRRAERLGAQTEKKEVLRALRLRRAAILEQRLGRVSEACDELTRLLADWPNSPGALRYLADLLGRCGEHARAVPLWQRAAALEEDPGGRDELELRTARAALDAGDPAGAMERVAGIGSTRPAYRAALELRADIARVTGSDDDLGRALEGIEASEGSDGWTRSELLLEAAQAAARAGDQRSAQDRAFRAAEAAPERATPQLLARALEYRVRGAGAPEDARRTIDDLGRIRETVEGPDAALRAFLLAEALDVVQGGGAGLRELAAARAHIGDHPLIALGMAERFAAMGESSAAVDEYRLALRGSLLDLRKAGAVALHAADSALLADRYQEAPHFLDLAETDPDSRVQAQALRARLAERTAPPAASARKVAIVSDLRLDELTSAVSAADTPIARAKAKLALAHFNLDRGDRAAAEPLLWEALAAGLAEAGDLLAPMMSSVADRGRDLVRLRRQQVVIQPGDVGRLELLRAAALADGDRVYGRAVEHVLRAFDPGAGPLLPPPLFAQPEQPGIFALLTRPSRDSAGEALAAVWEGATRLFARDPDKYGIPGFERVLPGPTSAVARLYEAALRVLDVSRIPLYLTASSAGAPSAEVAVLSNPSVLLSGDAREETAALHSALGSGIAATLPHNVLRLGLARADGVALVDAMRAAFGPPEIGRRVDAHAARLAQSFWQTVPARTQRRLQELLGAGTFPDHAELVARARQSARRVGMFLAGDFAWAARHLAAESAADFRSPLSLETLRSACDEVRALADLLTLAVSPEYAQARWHVVASGQHRGMLPSGRFVVS